MLRLNHVDDTHCQGIVFEVTDIDALARTIAVVLVQEYELARQLVTGDSACTGAITLENSDIEDIIQRRLHPTVDFHGCGFSPRFSRAGGSRGTNHRLQAPCSLGGGSIRRKAFQAGVYPPPAQPTGFSR